MVENLLRPYSEMDYNQKDSLINPIKKENGEDILELHSEECNKQIRYKYNEDDYLREIGEYIDSTYSQHYQFEQGNIQVWDLLSAIGVAEGKAIGDIIKYASRFGKKDGFNRKDVLKIIHYGILLLNELDKKSR